MYGESRDKISEQVNKKNELSRKISIEINWVNCNF